MALYKLAHITKNGHGISKSCITAVNGFKAVAERSHWSRKLTLARRLFEVLSPADDSSKDTFDRFEISHRFEISDQKSILRDHNLYKEQVQHLWLFVKHFILNFSIIDFFSFALGPPHDVVNYEESEVAKAVGTRIKSHEKNERNNQNAALVLYSQLASVGYEVAQTNAAHILSKSFCPPWLSPSTVRRTLEGSKGLKPFEYKYSHPDLSSLIPDNDMNVDTYHIDYMGCDVRSLLLYGLSATQGNADAHIRVGDFYYFGKAGIARNKQIAVRYYQLAASKRHAHAIFNLGIMYEMGDDVPQDFHLAKRFYDQAAEFEYNTKIPCDIALFLLSCHRVLRHSVRLERIRRTLCVLIEISKQLLQFSRWNTTIYLFPDERTRVYKFTGRFRSDELSAGKYEAKTIFGSTVSLIHSILNDLDISSCILLSLVSMTMRIARYLV